MKKPPQYKLGYTDAVDDMATAILLTQTSIEHFKVKEFVKEFKKIRKERFI